MKYFFKLISNEKTIKNLYFAIKYTKFFTDIKNASKNANFVNKKVEFLLAFLVLPLFPSLYDELPHNSII